jgi:uncharacterized protein Smg (DUF494 family)
MSGSDRPWDHAVSRLLQLVAERLESYLEGDETALETLGESIEQGHYTTDEVQGAILLLRSLAGPMPGSQAFAPHAPGKRALRVPSAEERATLSPDAWGYLIDLRGRGSLDGEQFERVIEILTGSGVRPIGVELARDVATRVALEVDDSGESGENRASDFDLTH